MVVKKGKQFEEDFKKSCEAEKINNVDVNRLYDNVGGYAGIKNICDFIVYKKPCIFYFELKSYQGKSIPIDAVSDYQRKGLYDKRFIQGAIPGVLLRFDDYKKAFFVHIAEFVDFMNDATRKSIPLEWCEDNCIEIPVTKQNRVSCVYDIATFLDRLLDRYS